MCKPMTKKIANFKLMKRKNLKKWKKKGLYLLDIKKVKR